MLETRQYFGIKEESNLVSIAGIHVYSKNYKVAALGNITTSRAVRNKGHATKTTARLCQSLIEDEIEISLNVNTDNISAISCYKKIGFEVKACYGEFVFEGK